MAVLSIPEKNIEIRNPDEVRQFFNKRGIFFDQWSCDVVFDDAATQEEILAAYAKDLDPFMEKGGYKTADVISINKLTENYDEIRKVFLAEHTHSEDEIRFFVDGQGLFWFNLENGDPIFNLLCERGDLISVPAGTKHWFDAGESEPFVKAIRIFIETSGWTPVYTESKVEEKFEAFQVPDTEEVKYILTDIEGTTTSVSFVYEVLFPYFRENISQLKDLKDNPDVQKAFEAVQSIAAKEGEELNGVDAIIQKLEEWSKADKKITPLKTLQGVLWKEAYLSGAIKGHVYDDVVPQFKKWKAQGIQLGVFSSGSVAAQKLLFGYSEAGDLTPLFSHYFDTTTGHKKEASTYPKIAEAVGIAPQHILFLSDVVAELEAAEEAGFQTLQLLRAGTEKGWNRTAKDFDKIIFNTTPKAVLQ